MDGFFPNQVSDCCDYKRHGCSKAQACLEKILRIISSIEAPVKKESNSGQCFGGEKGFGIDLNLSLVGPFWESGESTESLVANGDLSGCSVVCKEEEEKTTEGSSDITNSVVDSVQANNTKEGEEEEEEDDGVKTVPFFEEQERGGGNDCLDLLIAAAELISSTESGSASRDKRVTSHDDDDDDKQNNDKKWRADEDDTSPVVKSKRGKRTQVLPHRYRDSVLLEPWKRLKTTATAKSKYK